MKVRSLLAVAAFAAAAASASAFKWTPVNLNPFPSADVTSSYAAANVNFQVYEVEGVAITDVMPVWLDEEGNEIKAVSGVQDDFNPNQFLYEFNSSDFKANGEYILLFPEGMLVNAAGEKSDKLQTPYSFDVPEFAAAMFDDFKVLSIDPDLSQPQAVWNDQKITIDTNHNEAIGMTKLSITDLTDDGEYATAVYSSNFFTMRELGDPNPIVWEVANTYRFFEGHEYKAELIFYNGQDEVNAEGVPTKIVARATYTFTGRVEGFKYSDITLLSVEPQPGSIVISKPEQAVFTYTFSGPVTIVSAYSPLGMNGMEVYPESCLTSNEDKTVWTLDLSDNAYVNSVDAVLTICINVRDLDGSQLKGDYGNETESYFQSEWQCDLGAFPIVVATPAAGETIDRLSEVVVKAENGEPLSWAWMGEVTVINQLGEVFGTLVPDETDGDAEEIRFSNWKIDGEETSIDLVKEGYYAIQFTPGCFLQGDQYVSKQSRSLVSTFIVTGNLDDTPDDPVVDPAEQEKFFYTAVDPENGSTVESLEVIKVFFPEEVSLDGCDVMVYNADKELVNVGAGDLDWDNFAFDYVLVKLNEPITVAGQYEVVIPARSICNDEFANSDGKQGLCNPEIRLVYTVGDGSAVESVAVAAEGDVYDVHGRLVLRNASASALKALPKGIYIIGGKKVVK